jgi:hypothetical protein
MSGAGQDFAVSVPVPEQRVRDMLVAALEGGTEYWCRLDGYELAEGMVIEDFYRGGRHQLPDEYFHWNQLIPFHSGCCLKITDRESNQEHRLDRDALARGLEVLAQKVPLQFARLLTGEDDADTADAFLQCCLLGDLIYS